MTLFIGAEAEEVKRFGKGMIDDGGAFNGLHFAKRSSVTSHP
jgi:hypothetical protein